MGSFNQEEIPFSQVWAEIASLVRSSCSSLCPWSSLFDPLGYSPDSTPAGKRAARVRALSLSVCASWPWPNVLTPGNRMGGSWVGETICLWAVLTADSDSDMKKPEFHRVHSLPQPFKVHSHHTWLLWSNRSLKRASAIRVLYFRSSAPPS